MTKTLIFATSNTNKVIEIKALLPSDYSVMSLSDLNFHDEIPETRDTIEGNALQKAEYLYKRLKKPCFAEDTGLEVKALNGEPGIYSARYAGPEKDPLKNMEKLLSKLEGVSDTSARFKTIIAYIDQAGTTSTYEGIVNGKIICQQRGSQGFGYDPIFVPDGFEKTFAEMNMSEKAEISHRSRALRKFISALNQ